jgi:hypothetical protein
MNKKSTIMNKFVILTLHQGNFEKQGFPASVQINEIGGQQPLFSQVGCLPPAPKIPQLFLEWQESFYDKLDLRLRAKSSPKKISSTQSTQELETYINKWLNSGEPEWQKIRDGLLIHLKKEGITPLFIQTEEPQLRQLPWS